MNFQDERFVKVFTRDTVNWALISWESRALFLFLLRKADRAGIIRTNGSGSRGIAALTGMPLTVVEPSIVELIDVGYVQATDELLLIPNFLEAQESHKSDAQRKRDQREKQRSIAVNSVAVSPQNHERPNETIQSHEESRNVTQDRTARDIKSQNVTLSHETGQKVTSGHEVSRAVTPRLDETRLDLNNTLSVVSDFELEPVSEKESSNAKQVFDFWVQALQKNKRTVFDSRRKGAVEKQLRNGFSVDDLKKAIVGCTKSPHNMGANDRGEAYNDLELICRNAANVERFMAYATNPPKPKLSGPMPVGDFSNIPAGDYGDYSKWAIEGAE